MRKLHTDIAKLGKTAFQKLYSWEAPDRHWKEKDKLWYVSYSLFFVVLIAVFTITGDYILVLLIIAFAFLWFIQGTIPPQIVEHTITTMGIKSFDKLFKWREIKYFWFSEKSGTFFLNIDYSEDTSPDLVKRLALIIPKEEDLEVLFGVLVKFIEYGEREKISFNVLSLMLQGKYIPLSRFLKTEEIE